MPLQPNRRQMENLEEFVSAVFIRTADATWRGWRQQIPLDTLSSFHADTILHSEELSEHLQSVVVGIFKFSREAKFVKRLPKNFEYLLAIGII